MKRICAWCKEDLTEENFRQSFKTDITHGICPECLEKYFYEKPVELKKFLDGLPVPVLMTDHDGVVKTANEAAQNLLKKNASLRKRDRGRKTVSAKA